MNDQSEFELIDLVKIVTKKWKLIVFITAIFGISAVFYSLSLPNTYKSEALLVSAEGGGAPQMGQINRLASFAGMDLSGNNGGDFKVNLEILQSRKFTEFFVNNNNLSPLIMAVESWDEINNKIIFNDSYNSSKNLWISGDKPENFKVSKEFKKSLSINFDPNSGFLQISFIHQSPYVARDIVEMMIKDINTQINLSAREESKLKIKYIRNQLLNSENIEMRDLFNQLLIKELQTDMLTNIKKEYFLKTVDPAIVPRERFSPQRSTISIYWSFVGFMMSIFFVFIQNFYKKIIDFLKE